MNEHKSRWLAVAGCSLALGVAGWCLALGIDLVGQPNTTVTHVSKTSSGESGVTPDDPEGPLSVEFEPLALVSGPTAQSLIVEARARAKQDLSVMRSIAVYDVVGNAVTAPARSAKIRLARAAGTQSTFTVPAGLPDGHYYAELLEAYAQEPNQPPLVEGHRVYFAVVAGQINLMTATEWAPYAVAQPARPL